MPDDHNSFTKKVTNYNNNYIQLHTNNNKVNIECAEAHSSNDSYASDESLRSSFEGGGLAVIAGGSNATRPNGPLPAGWDWIKADLYDNSSDHRPKHKLNITICQNGHTLSIKSLNNSPWSLYRRGIVDYQNNPHYQRVKQIREELKSTVEAGRIRVSKCYRAGYRGRIDDTVHNFSTILIDEPEDHVYSVICVYQDQEILIPLSGVPGRLSARQRQARQIATGMIRSITAPRGVDIDSLLNGLRKKI